jgi:hypothetical protein
MYFRHQPQGRGGSYSEGPFENNHLEHRSAIIVIFNEKLFLTKLVDMFLIYPHIDVIAVKRKAEYSYRVATILFGYVLQN